MTIRTLSAYVPALIPSIFAGSIIMLFLSPSLIWADVPFAETRSFQYLTTGNGHGFELFKNDENRMIAMLDHPYRYLHAPTDIRKDGPERRNLLEHLNLGLVDPAGDTALDDWKSVETEYSRQTNIIYNRSVSNGRTGERYIFSPFGLEKNAFIAMAHVEGATSVYTRLGFHLGANPVSSVFWDSTLKIIKLPGENLRRASGHIPAWVERGHGLGAMIYIPLGPSSQATGRMDCAINDTVGTPVIDVTHDKLCDALDLDGVFKTTATRGWWGVLVAYVENEAEADREAKTLYKWLSRRSNEHILADALKDFESWRVAPPPSVKALDEIKLWRQSETVLRMGQVREANHPASATRLASNGNGMILASLSPGHWATGWVRDGAYATVALARAGHFAEAKKSLEFFLNAQPVGKFKSYVGNLDYRISVTRYFGSGEEEADYSDQSTPNIETDGWGLVLWAARQYVQLSGDTSWLSSNTRDGTVFETLYNGIAQPIAAQLEPVTHIMKPDSSIWEVHQANARHFAFTSITATRGLCDFAALAHFMGRSREQRTYSLLAEEVRTAIPKNFGTADDYIVGAVERTTEMDEDGSTAEAFGLDIFTDFAQPIVSGTLNYLESHMRVSSGGFKRTGGPNSFQRNEWPFIDFRMMNAFWRAGKRAEADTLLKLLVQRASINFDLVPEMNNSNASDGMVGAYAGSIPMVGYGAGAYILSVLERGGSFEARDCGGSTAPAR